MHSLNRLALILSLGAIVQAAQAKVLEDVVATVNGRPLLLSEYKKNAGSVIDNYRRTMPDIVKDDDAMKELRQKVLDQMIDDEILAQEGEKLKLAVHDRELEKGIEEVQERNFRTDDATGKRRSDSEMKAALQTELDKEGLSADQFRERIRRQILIRKVVEEKVRSTMKESEDKDIKAAFEKLKFIVSGDSSVVKGMNDEEAQTYLAFGQKLKDLSSERVRVSHILVKLASSASMVEKTKALERATALKKRLDAGEDFSDLAGKESEDPESAPRGGDLGFILKGWMPPEFEKVAFTLAVGEISDPIETKFGFHIIRVQEKKAKESLNYERLRSDLAQFLYNLEFQKRLLDMVKKLRAKATIEVKAPTK